MWTDRQVKSFKPREARYRISEGINKRGGGRLVLDVLPNGRRHFYYQYFRDGGRKYVKVGSYKQSAKDTGYTLSEARDKAIEYSNILKQGLDVKFYLEEQRLKEKERIRRLEAAKYQGTFEQLLDSYLASLQRRGKRSHYNVSHSFTLYVKKPFPELLRKYAHEITPNHISLILRRMMERGITAQVNRTRSQLHAAFHHGLKQDNDPRRYAEEGVLFNLTNNPVSFIPKQADFERAGEHVIPENEIRIIWGTLSKKSAIVALIVKLALITGQRVGEIIRLRTANFDLKERTMLIPASVSKNGIDHLVPLSELGMSVVKETKEATGGHEYAFPGVRGGKCRGDIHINNTTVGKVVRRFCDETDNVTKFIPRDIRRTVKTLMGKAGISKELRDRIQNHSLTDVSSKHYDRYDYLKEKRHGLKVWNDYLDLIINPRKKVTHIRKRA